MGRVKDFILGFFVFLVVGGLITLVYNYEKGKTHRDLAKRIAGISPRGGPPETFEGLRETIAAYEAQIELNVKEGAQTGVYWKILATRLADKGMHRDALDALQRAIDYNAEDPALFYLTGVSAGIVAGNSLEFSANSPAERDRYYRLAETSYLRAIDLDGGYPKPRYALGVLYAFNLNRPADAVPHLERYLELMSSDVDAMFVLARAYYMTERYDNAVELYDRIIGRSKNEEVKKQALNNKEYILGGSNG
ncbi:MAG: tetratricopeptide repeat protein [Treponema sp.]|jgi:tetratricopeptide (TPR) repeat protein|nr:tetratricopeptide repeat protein [Treponema sp.]